jgi:ADP-heptose:LPS heptosyltransferase
MRKLILRTFLSPGDVVMLTAAVRDLHQCYPGAFETDVRTSCKQLWEHNPYVTRLDEAAPGVEVLDVHYPLIQHSNQAPYHFLEGYIDFLNDALDVQIKPTRYRGDIHLSRLEKSWMSQVHEIVGTDVPFWIVVAGGKYDYTIKWWDPARYQDVVDHFAGRILFVQVGDTEHYHPALDGVVDLRGRTDLRQLVRLVYHSQGVLCPVTSLMHLAAAIDTKAPWPACRPCVVVAGGREPPQWEAYSGHQFIHTVGALSCCSRGGCWRSRTLPLGDGDPKDEVDQLCSNVVGTLPKCMDLITSDDVIRRVELYFKGGMVRYLTAEQARLVNEALAHQSRGRDLRSHAR